MPLSLTSPFIFWPNLFANKLGFSYDPSLPIWANDSNSAFFARAQFYAILTNIIAYRHVLPIGIRAINCEHTTGGSGFCFIQLILLPC